MRALFIVVFVAAFLVSGCCSTEGMLKVDVVKKNWEAVKVPYLRYVDNDADMPAESKAIRHQQCDEFDARIKQSEEEVKGDG